MGLFRKQLREEEEKESYNICYLYKENKSVNTLQDSRNAKELLLYKDMIFTAALWWGKKKK